MIYKNHSGRNAARSMAVHITKDNCIEYKNIILPNESTKDKKENCYAKFITNEGILQYLSSARINFNEMKIVLAQLQMYNEHNLKFIRECKYIKKAGKISKRHMECETVQSIPQQPPPHQSSSQQEFTNSLSYATNVRDIIRQELRNHFDETQAKYFSKSMCIEKVKNCYDLYKRCIITAIPHVLNQMSDNMIIALIWIRPGDTYRIVMQNKQLFDNQYRYVLKSFKDVIRNRFNNAEVNNEEASHVIIGQHLYTNDAQYEWFRFKINHLYFLFDMKFLNYEFTDFIILDKQSLIDKFHKMSSVVKPIVASASTPFDRYDDILYKNLNLQNVQDCLNKCYIENIWNLYCHLFTQMTNVMENKFCA